MVASGPNSGFPHYNLTTRVIKEGDAIVIDFGCEYKRVRSDITRTIFIGKPTDKQREVYDLVRAANEAAEKLLLMGHGYPILMLLLERLLLLQAMEISSQLVLAMVLDI